MKEIRKFGIRDQIGYVCGDMAGSFVNLYVDAFSSHSVRMCWESRQHGWEVCSCLQGCGMHLTIR